MPLTELACRHAKPKEKPYKLADGEGLYLLVQPSGGRLWRLAYRFDNKQKTLAFGAYPTVLLSEAREQRLAAKRQLKAGNDPAVVKKQAKSVGRDLPTFKNVALEWLDTKAAIWSPGHMLRVKNRLDEDVFTSIGDLPISEIKAADILDRVLRRVEDRGALDIAKRIKQSISQVFRFAIATSRAEFDPAAHLSDALKQSPRVKHRAALKARELPEFVGRLAQYDGDPMTRLALDFTMTTFVRTSETRYATIAEFEDLHGPKPLWRIPPERMKVPREHLVPLTPRAVKIVLAAMKLGADLGVKGADLGVNDAFLFPGASRDGALSQNTMLFACYRMGYHGRMTVHGLRGTASTMLNEKGFNRDWIEMQLAHVEQDAIRGAYNSAEWLPQRRDMMLWWSGHLDGLDEMAALLR